METPIPVKSGATPLADRIPMTRAAGDERLARALATVGGSIEVDGRRIGPRADVPPRPRDDELWLVHRTTQGFTEADYAEARAMGYRDWLEYQLDHESIPESQVLLDTLALFPSLEMSAREILDNYVDNPFLPVAEARVAAFLRAWLSRRQLHEVMEEFFRNLLNVFILKDAMWLFFAPDHREVIRAHALGNFPDMLRASARSPAMLYYLDNWASRVGNINENYSRELMELHTLGVEGPYEESDVVEVARSLTGWTIITNAGAQNFGDFRFAPSFHDFGEKTVLGNVIPAGGGVTDGDYVLDLFAHHPSTAQYVSRRMIRWLLMYDPPQSLVDRVAGTYLATGGDIKAMLRTIFQRSSVDLAGTQRKLRRPYHFVISLMRAVGPSLNGIEVLNEMDRLGQSPYYWPAPNGYPDSVEAWGGNVLGRWDFATKFFDNDVPGLQITNQRLSELYGPTPQGLLAQRANAVLTGGRLPAREVARIQAYADGRPLNSALRRTVLALTAASPSFQWY